MTINYNNNTIELTTAEMKEAQKYGSDMYNMVREARIDNPGFKVKEVKTKKSKNDFSDLNLKTIKTYATIPLEAMTWQELLLNMKSIMRIKASVSTRR